MRRVLIAACLLSFVLGATPANATGVGTYNVRTNTITGGANSMKTLHTSWLYYDGGQQIHAHCFGTNKGNNQGIGMTEIVINKCTVNVLQSGNLVDQGTISGGAQTCTGVQVGESCVGNSTNLNIATDCAVYSNVTIEVHDKITVYYTSGGSDTSTHDAGSNTCHDLGV